MKKLTREEFLEAPTKVQFLYLMSMLNTPVGAKSFEDAIKESPEYFPDELEHRRKWALIPQQVHDDYWKERDVLHKEIFNDMPPSKGIVYWVENPQDYTEWILLYKNLRQIEEPLAEAIHKNHYNQYGIEWNGL
jgi:hypothetical protein